MNIRESITSFFSQISGSFKVLIRLILSVFLISDGLHLTYFLILIFFAPLFLIIFAVPLDGSWVRTIGTEPNQTGIVYGLKLQSLILVYISDATESINVFKDTFSNLVIPLITAYSLKSIDTEEIPNKVRFFLSYLVFLLFLSMLGNAMLHAVNLESIAEALNEISDISDQPVPTLETIRLTEDTVNSLQESTSNYIKDCLTYIALTIGITYKSR